MVCWAVLNCDLSECDTAGDTGDGMHEYVNYGFASKFSFPHIDVIYPTAPFR